MRCLRFWLFLLVTGLTPGAGIALAADSLNMRTVGRWPRRATSLTNGEAVVGFL